MFQDAERKLLFRSVRNTTNGRVSFWGSVGNVMLHRLLLPFARYNLALHSKLNEQSRYHDLRRSIVSVDRLLCQEFIDGSLFRCYCYGNQIKRFVQDACNINASFEKKMSFASPLSLTQCHVFWLLKVSKTIDNNRLKSLLMRNIKPIHRIFLPKVVILN